VSKTCGHPYLIILKFQVSTQFRSENLKLETGSYLIKFISGQFPSQKLRDIESSFSELKKYEAFSRGDLRATILRPCILELNRIHALLQLTCKDINQIPNYNQAGIYYVRHD